MTGIVTTLPAGMTPEDAAKVFSGYLQAGRSQQYGPFLKPGGDGWQLDGGNDYWLHADSNSLIRLTCRYEHQQKLVRAMVSLFDTQMTR